MDNSLDGSERFASKDGERTAVFGGVTEENSGVEIGTDFAEALDRDETELKKEMGKEGYLEVQKAVLGLADDPYMLNVKVQDMSDTLILRAFGRVRDGK